MARGVRIQRDSKSGGLVSTDSAALEAYRAKRKREKDSDGAVHDINTLKKRVDDLEQLVWTIARILKKRND